MRYHAHMEFRIDNGPEALVGMVGTIAGINFSTWMIELRLPTASNVLVSLPRRLVTLVNHDDCSARPCRASIERTASEP